MFSGIMTWLTGFIASWSTVISEHSISQPEVRLCSETGSEQSFYESLKKEGEGAKEETVPNAFHNLSS